MYSSETRKLDEKPQYQHFIPQFILRKFSDFRRPVPKGDPKEDTHKLKRAKTKAKINTLVFEQGYKNAHLETMKPGKIFGKQDMYSDTSPNAVKKNLVEEQLSKLELEASKIITRIDGDLEASRPGFELTRTEKDILRRFLFIMLYRNRNLGDRFCKSKSEYDAPDREQLLAYMQKNGFENPKDVWLSNLSVFLNEPINIDPAHWLDNLQSKSYPPDATWMVKHFTQFFLSFCVPASSAAEFILTENVYGIFEGPASLASWTDWHVFAPLSPKLLVVMRTNILHPFKAEELPGVSAKQLAILEETRKEQIGIHSRLYRKPEQAHSILADLPIARPKTSYRTIHYGDESSLTDIYNSTMTPTDTFNYRFFSLSEEHSQRINCIFLEEAIDTNIIVSKTKAGLRLAIEAYLLCRLKGFKVVYSQNHAKSLREHIDILSLSLRSEMEKRAIFDPYRRVDYLEMLAHTVAQWGSSVKACYDVTIPEVLEIPPRLSNLFSKRIDRLAPESRNSFDLLHDISQAHRVAKLRTVTDRMVHEWHLSADIAGNMRSNRRNYIESLPSRWVWLYLRILRVMMKLGDRYYSGRRDMTREIVADHNTGPEDVLVDAYNVFSCSESFNRTMTCVFELDTYTHGQRTLPQADTLLTRIFYQPGSVLRCGIPSLEKEAMAIYLRGFTQHTLYTLLQAPGFAALSEFFQQELCTRVELKMSFGRVLKPYLPEETIVALEDVFFSKLYACRID